MITKEYINYLFNYIEDIGYLSWKRPLTNRNYTGRLILPTHTNGYCTVSINKSKYYVHHLIWLLHYGEWPNGIVDHINGIPDDNRITNLRILTHSENIRNTKRFRNGESGIHYNKRDKKKIITTTEEFIQSAKEEIANG